MKALVSAALLSLALAGPAFASQCPSDIAKIDQALQTASLSADQKAQVMELRNEGERLHQGGQHAASVETLAQAKEILGVQ
ncbi:hypothetical protein [Pelagibius marinus]|uniref:hypothetical protein n=1 Tax=Pelagibius marinus TaxID=2762760 RepID=UPI001872F152|nr:hypothetical protein [Pelagibius marinus]